MGGGARAKSTEAEVTADTVTLTPEEQKEVTDAGKLISLEKAEIYARALTYLDLTEYKISYSNLSENELFNDGFSWYLRFYKAATKTSEESYASVTLDAVTGTITNFMIDRKYVKGEKGKISLADL